MKNSRFFVPTLLLISLFQLDVVGMSPIVASLTEAFPGTSDTTAQLSMTLICLLTVVTALLSGAISKKLGRRMMCAVGMGLTALSGLCGALLTVRLWMVFVWSVFLGVGAGMFVPAVASMMIDFLEEKERNTVAGMQTSAVNLGGVALSLLAGLLASAGWRNAYFAYLLALPVFFFALRFLPKEQAPAQQARTKRTKLPSAVLLATLQTFLFAILYFGFSTNISLLLVERGIGSTVLSGAATSVFMLGGCAFGFAFSSVVKVCKGRSPALAFLLLGISYLVLFCSESVVLTLLAGFIGGGSLSIIFPYFLVTIANQVDASISVLSSSLILSVGPNLGSFFSPTVLNTLAGLFSGTVSARFLLAAVLALCMACVLLLCSLRKTARG